MNDAGNVQMLVLPTRMERVPNLSRISEWPPSLLEWVLSSVRRDLHELD